MDLKSEIAERLREFRSNLGLSQKELTEELTIKPGTWSSYEKGTTTPSIAVLKELRDQLDLDLNWLITGKKHNLKKVDTYDEFIKLIFELPDFNVTEIEDPEYIKMVENIETITNEPYDPDSLVSTLEKEDIPAISFKNSELNEIIRQFSKILDAYNSGTFDDEMVTIWIQKQLKKYQGKKINH